MEIQIVVTPLVTTLIALYAALLSTGVAGWNIYREVTNRGRLRVRVTLADVFAPGLGPIASNRLWFKVTNVGRQPIWLTQIGGGLRNGKHFLITMPKQFPIKLEPGETFDDASADAAQLKKEEITFLGAWDTLGKLHRLGRRELRALRQQLK